MITTQPMTPNPITATKTVIRVCPCCGNDIAHGLRSCLRCGWKLSRTGSALSQTIATMTLMFFLLTVTGSCAYYSFEGSRGDDQGYGLMALVQSAILILTIWWLSVSFSLRSQAPKYRKVATMRASAGAGLAVGAFGLAFVAAQQDGLKTNDWLRIGLLALSGVALFLSSLRTLKSAS